MQGKRILWPEEGFEVSVIPAGPQSFTLDAPGGGRVLLEEAEGEVTQHGEVLRGMRAANPTGIFAKGDIQHPMQAILNAPVAAHGLPKLFGIRPETRQILAPLDRRRFPHIALRLHHP